MKKKLVWMLAIATLLSSVGGCAKTNKSETTTTTQVTETTQESTTEGSVQGDSDTEEVVEEVEEVVEDTLDLPAKDLGGYEFEIVTFQPDYFAPTVGADELSDARIARNMFVEDEFNCKIVVKENTDVGKFAEDLQVAVMAGDKYADMIVPTQWNFGKMLVGELLENVKEVPHLRLDKPYWDPATLKMSTIGEEAYAIGSYTLTPLTPFGMFVNKEILNEIGISEEELYEIIDSGQWTMDKFIEISKKAVRDLNGDGVMDGNDRWGFMGPSYEVPISFFGGTGITALDHDENNGLAYTLDRPETIDTINKIKEIMHDHNIMYALPTNEDWTKTMQYFQEDKALFYIYRTDHVWTEIESDWSVIPFPKGPHSTQYYGWVDHNAPVIVFPKGNPNLENAGLITEALAWKASKEETEIRNEQLQERVYINEKDFEYYQFIQTIGSFDPMYAIRQGVDGVDGIGMVIHESCNNPEIEVTSQLAATTESIKTNLKDFLDNFSK